MAPSTKRPASAYVPILHPHLKWWPRLALFHRRILTVAFDEADEPTIQPNIPRSLGGVRADRRRVKGLRLCRRAHVGVHP